MSRVSAKVGYEDAPAEVKALYETFRREKRNIPNLYQALALAPANLLTLVPHSAAVYGASAGPKLELKAAEVAPGPLSFPLKLLIRLAVSEVNGCSYCLDVGIANARKLGYSDDELKAVWRLEAGQLGAPLYAALQLVTKMTRDARSVTDGDFETLRKHFTEAQIIEMVQVASLAGYINRMAVTLRMNITATGQPFDEWKLP